MQSVIQQQSPTGLGRPSAGSLLRAVLAIARKDWRTYWRYPLNALSTVFQPLIWLAPVYFMGLAFSLNGQARGFAAYAGTSDFMSFILLGTVLNQFVMSVFWGMGYALKTDMDSGVLEANWLAPIPRVALLVGHTLANLALTAILSLAMLALAARVFGFHPTGNALGALLSVLPMLLGLYGFGFAFAALVLLVREANTMVDVSSFLVQTFSGSEFPVNSLPRWLLPLSLALPLTYGYDATRGWLLGTRTLLPLPAEIALMALFMVTAIVFGVWAFGRRERHVRRKGTLGQH